MSGTKAVPGQYMLHPVVLGSIGLLLLNDHVLKARFANWWTGKLSDVAGLVFFPLLLLAAYELLSSLFGVFERHSRRALIVVILTTAVVFSVIQVTQWGADAYRWGLGSLQAIVQGRWHRVFSPILVKHWADPSDLLALPALGVALWIGWRYAE